MRIVSIKKLKDFWESSCADSEQPLKVWHQIIKRGNFLNSNDIKLLFPSSSIIGDRRIVFNISGNKYRLVVHVRYDIQIVYIRFVGTHAEYDKINAQEV
jgi:mRNA interferase HigB